MAEEQTVFEKIAAGKTRSHIIYEDDAFMAILRENGACIGHATLFPKQPYLIFEQLPPNLASDVLFLANKVSVALFETIGAKGTNVIINNGNDAGQEINHFSVDIIPRQENDGITVDWEPQKVSQDDIKSYGKKISDALVQVNYQSKQKETPDETNETSNTEEPEQINAEDHSKEEPNYMLKQLDRLP
jgi:histidine triad (HIT) family protein